ncbi:MAG: hypothetical protein HOZ81_10730 [Streptomyces sp.]|nr:hypothetical protein [Streptomyces sp.]NUS24275.1 hypothetical protein [Streptomyces sp.]
MASNKNMIAALLRERAGYKAQGKTDRVRQVDEQLVHYGYEPEKDEPKGRTQAPQQTADQGKPPAKKTATKRTTTAPPAESASSDAPASPPAE